MLCVSTIITLYVNGTLIITIKTEASVVTWKDKHVGKCKGELLSVRREIQDRYDATSGSGILYNKNVVFWNLRIC